MIGEMIKKIDNEFRKCSPDIVVLFGDTNSTLSDAVLHLHINVKLFMLSQDYEILISKCLKSIIEL